MHVTVYEIRLYLMFEQFNRYGLSKISFKTDTFAYGAQNARSRKLQIEKSKSRNNKNL